MNDIEELISISKLPHNEDVKIIDEHNSEKFYLTKEIEKIDAEESDISIEELDKVLEERISKYENKNP